jgi:DNA recombination-dependent growth factor C
MGVSAGELPRAPARSTSVELWVDTTNNSTLVACRRSL